MSQDYLIIVLILFILIEVMFRLLYRLYTGYAYKNVSLHGKKVYVEQHPYISFVMKPDHLTESSEVASYPLHKGLYYFGSYRTNNMGFLNGKYGDRDVISPKPKGMYRVNCLGASTTGNYIVSNNKSFSYPLELETNLNFFFKKPVEVNNFGQGAYNSADILSRFMLQIVDTNPDCIVIYHGYNDIRSYLTKCFKSDYSHSIRNLGESIWKINLAKKIPNIPIKFINFLIKRLLFGNVRGALSHAISKGEFDINQDSTKGLETYRRNLQHIIDICKANNIEIILSTFCHFLYDEIKNNPKHLVYEKNVNMENIIIRDLASKNNITCVDNANLISKKEENFVDSIHFTPTGMKAIAKNISKAIIELNN